MSDGRARIVAELAGQSQVVSGLKSIGGAVSGLASQALSAAGLLQGFSLSHAIGEAKQLDAQTAKLGQSAGRSGAELKTQFEGLERRLLAPAPLLAQVSRQIGRMTYDTNYGIRSMQGLGDVALATGRDIEDMVGLGAALKDFGADDVGRELGNVRDIAEQLNTIGGPTALYDTLEAIAPQLRQVSADSEDARKRVVALVAASGKGRSPGEQKAVAGGLLQALQARAMDLERVTGKRQLDDQGNLIDPLAMAKELQRRALKANGGDRAAARRALIGRYGADVGSFLVNANFDEIEKTAKQAKDRGANAADAGRFQDTDAAKRMQQEIARKAAERQAGEQALPVIDAVTDTVGPFGMLFGGTLGGAALSGLGLLLKTGAAAKAATGAAGAAGAATSGGAVGLDAVAAEILAEGGAGANALANHGLFHGALKTGGAAGGAALAGVAATAAAQLYAASQLGEDRDVMGAKWRSKQADTIGAEIAAQAQQRGDLMPVIGKAGGDQAAITAALLMLEKQFDKLPDRLAEQVAEGLAATLHRQPLVARVARDPKDQAVN